MISLNPLKWALRLKAALFAAMLLVVLLVLRAVGLVNWSPWYYVMGGYGWPYFVVNLPLRWIPGVQRDGSMLIEFGLFGFGESSRIGLSDGDKVARWEAGFVAVELAWLSSLEIRL